MEKIRWKKFPRYFISRVQDSNISSSSVMIAFYFLLSLFPLLVTVATLLPFFRIDPNELLPYLESILPLPVVDVLLPVLNGLLTTTHGGLLSFGIITTIWSASRSMKFIQSGIDAAYGVQETPTFIIARIISVGTFILVIALLLCMMVLFSVGELLLERFATVAPWAAGVLANLGTIQWPVAMIVLLCTLVLIYLSAPNLHLRIRDVLPGAVLCMACLVLSVRIFALYLNNAVRAFSAYHTLSSLFILMLWARMVAYVLLAGAILNAALHGARNGGPPVRRLRADVYLRNQFLALRRRLQRWFNRQKQQAGGLPMKEVQIPPIGLGVYNAGTAVYHAVRTALELGYRHIDTAANYGNEEDVGRAIRESGIAREDIFLTTKLAVTDFPRAEQAFMESLQKLGTDYVDAYLLHWPGPHPQLRHSAWKAILSLEQRGLVRMAGVSNFMADELDDLIDQSGILPGCNQLELHPWHQQKTLVAHCKKLGIPVVAWAPLYRGAIEQESVLLQLAEKYARTPAQVTLRWHTQLGHIPIPKSSNPKRIRENFEIFDFTLSDEDMALINALDRNEGITDDRRERTYAEVPPCV